MIKYSGSCHCGAVKFEVLASAHLKVIDCNCSGHDSLTTYTFNTNTAQHKFCSKCGVQSFYYPRSNPEDVAVMPHCIDSPQPLSVTMENFDGSNWENSIQISDIQYRSLPSK